MITGCSGSDYREPIGIASRGSDGTSFKEQMQAGCSSSEQCRALLEHARRRLQLCQPNVRGPNSCLEAANDLERVTNLYMAQKRSYLEQIEAQQVQAPTPSMQRERWDREMDRRNREAWESIDSAKCAERGERSDCVSIEIFLQDRPNSPRRGQAEKALSDGRAAAERIARENAEAAEAARKAAEEAAKKARATGAAQPKQAQKPKPENDCAPYIRCCDGSCSPSCTNVHRGCCSHHGGVCN
jgi:hypothetical protein